MADEKTSADGGPCARARCVGFQHELALPKIVDGLPALRLAELAAKSERVLCGLLECECRTGRCPTVCARRYRREHSLIDGQPPDAFVDVRIYDVSTDPATGRRTIVSHDRRYTRPAFLEAFGLASMGSAQPRRRRVRA